MQECFHRLNVGLLAKAIYPRDNPRRSALLLSIGALAVVPCQVRPPAWDEHNSLGIERRLEVVPEVSLGLRQVGLQAHRAGFDLDDTANPPAPSV